MENRKPYLITQLVFIVIKFWKGWTFLTSKKVSHTLKARSIPRIYIKHFSFVGIIKPRKFRNITNCNVMGVFRK